MRSARTLMTAATTVAVAAALMVPGTAGAKKTSVAKAKTTSVVKAKRSHPGCTDGVLVRLHAHVLGIPIDLCL